MAVLIRNSLLPVVDENGLPLAGAKLYIYAAQTTTPLALFSDADLVTPAANPIVISTSGVCPKRYIAPASYKIVATRADGSSLPDYSGDDIDPGIPLGAGALGIPFGGTGATDAGTARTNLGVPSQGEVDGLAGAVANVTGLLVGPAGTQIGAGTTAQRPGNPDDGKLRYNTDNDRFEGYEDGAWQDVMTTGQKADQAIMEAATDNDTFVPPAMMIHHPAIPKAWALIKNTSNGTYTIEQQFGFSGLVKNSTGDLTLTLTNAMSTAVFPVVLGYQSSSTSIRTLYVKALSTTTVRFEIQNPGTGVSDTGTDYISVVVWGDR